MRKIVMPKKFGDIPEEKRVQIIADAATLTNNDPVFTAITACELSDRVALPGSPVKNSLSPLFTKAPQARARLFEEMLTDMTSKDCSLPENFYSEMVLNGDEIHVLLVIIHMARTRGQARVNSDDEIVSIKTSGREVLTTIGWGPGGNQQEKLFRCLKKLGNNAYIQIDAQGKRRYGTGFLFALGKEDSLIIEIAAPIIEIVNNYYYAVSLSFLRGLEAQKTQERTPLTALCLTPKQRRMTKAFYVLSKVQALPKTAHWLYFFHITGEPTSMKDKRRRNEAKGDTLCAISFLKKCGLVDVDRDPKGKNITFSKAQMLIEIEKRDVKE